MAWLENFFPVRELEIYPLANERPRRLIYEFARNKTKNIQEKLTLRNNDGSYTEEYRQLTREFYLNL